MNKTAANLLYFSVAVVLVRTVGALTTFVLARILTPASYGIWVTLLVIVSYSSIICLGTLEALVKLFPFYAGRGDATTSKKTESDVFGSIALAAALLCILGATFHFFVPAAQGPLLPAIRLMVTAACMGLFSAFYYYRFTAHQDFRSAGFIDSLRAIMLFVLIVPLSWRWGLMGAALAFVANETVILSYSFIVNKWRLGDVPLRFDMRGIGRLIAVGFPITVIWWTYMLQTSADRLISISMLGREATGYYGLGASMASAIVLAPMVLGRVLYPKVNEEVGKNIGRFGLSRYVLLPAQALGLALPLLIGPLLLCTGDLIHLLFAKYVRGIAAAQILVLGVYFACMIRTGVNYLVAIDRQNTVLVFVAISLAANIGLSIAFVKIGLNIEGISIGTAVSGLVLATLLWKSTFAHMGYSFLKQLEDVFFLYLPFFLCAFFSGALLLISRAITPRYALLMHIAFALAFVVLYCAAVFIVPPLNTWAKEMIRDLPKAVFSKTKQPN